MKEKKEQPRAIPGGGVHPDQIRLRLGRTLHAEVVAAAQAGEVTVSEWVRVALHDRLDRAGAQAQAQAGAAGPPVELHTSKPG